MCVFYITASCHISGPNYYLIDINFCFGLLMQTPAPCNTGEPAEFFIQITNQLASLFVCFCLDMSHIHREDNAMCSLLVLKDNAMCSLLVLKERGLCNVFTPCSERKGSLQCVHSLF